MGAGRIGVKKGATRKRVANRRMAPHWTGILILAILILVFFGGRGRISNFMGDFAKGIKSFRKGLKEDDEAARAEKAKPIDAAAPGAQTAKTAEDVKAE